jgi:hypothetical protein
MGNAAHVKELSSIVSLCVCVHGVRRWRERTAVCLELIFFVLVPSIFCSSPAGAFFPGVGQYKKDRIRIQERGVGGLEC